MSISNPLSEQYDILLDIVRQWKKDDKDINPRALIDEKKKKYNIRFRPSDDRVIYIDLSSSQISGLMASMPPSISTFFALEELNLSDNQLSGSIPPSIGTLKGLVMLNLSKNQLSGAIPTSFGELSNLEILDLSNNKNLSGGLPPMINTGCKIAIYGTDLSRIEIKTKPLKHRIDYFFLVSHVVIGYFDLVMDILAIIALSNNIPIMIANILFIVLNVALGVWMSRNDVMGILRTVFQVDQLYQGYMTIVKRHQTDEMIISKKIDAVTRSLPSMILQLYGLLKSLSEADSNDDDAFLSRFLTPNEILLLSVASSILGAGLTLASLARNSGDTLFNKHFVIHYAYYTVEITNRVVILSVMFISVDSYGFLVAGLDFLSRLYSGYYGLDKKLRDLREGTMIAIQSFGSDHTILGKKNFMLYFGFVINTLEMFIFLIVMNTLKTPHLEAVRSKGACTILTIVACMTWLIRLVFYYAGVLDIPVEDNRKIERDWEHPTATLKREREFANIYN